MRPLVVGPAEVAVFLLANAIIIWICAPRLLGDVRRWMAGSRQGP